MSKRQQPWREAARISDPQYERELRELETDRDEQLAEWHALLQARGVKPGEPSYIAKPEYLNQFIEITGRFWYAREEAYFRCCKRNPGLVTGRIGRPAKHFRWFELGRVGAPRRGRKRVERGEQDAIDRAAALLRSHGDLPRGARRFATAAVLAEVFDRDRQVGRRLRENFHRYVRDEPEEVRRLVRAVRAVNAAKFDRIVRAVSRAIARRPW